MRERKLAAQGLKVSTTQDSRGLRSMASLCVEDGAIRACQHQSAKRGRRAKSEGVVISIFESRQPAGPAEPAEFLAGGEIKSSAEPAEPAGSKRVLTCHPNNSFRLFCSRRRSRYRAEGSLPCASAHARAYARGSRAGSKHHAGQSRFAGEGFSVRRGRGHSSVPTSVCKEERRGKSAKSEAQVKPGRRSRRSRRKANGFSLVH